jgi:hypothetical protein
MNLTDHDTFKDVSQNPLDTSPSKRSVQMYQSFIREKDVFSTLKTIGVTSLVLIAWGGINGILQLYLNKINNKYLPLVYLSMIIISAVCLFKLGMLKKIY